MLVTFRIEDTRTQLHSTPAEISALELAALTRRLHASDIALDVDANEFGAAPLNFEINANSLSMAAFTACFDHRAEIIAIVEEAQFLGRTLRVRHLGRLAPITIEVSEHIALARDLMMGPDLAGKVLFALGRDNADAGELTLDSLRTLLQNHRTYDAFRGAKIMPIYDSLAYLAFTNCGEQRPVLAWAS
ncbi:hypothetical protein CP97_15069 (plasmid) [Aurantiacibacter atlanticus]|jgi:hypothetical protein|uniref:Uncharacterized protein n=4 Tax=Sphingomonadales TaxID=204457 RepID=A0A168M6B8_9SPHN|nr:MULTISPECIES: hypothetical protein [Sphingomonadales]MBL4897545.1 hypothetical protein [Erythrobacter sp.]MDF1835978.1 hypothetical protein [Alteraurantiacibacter sp. bin_em_oilr2.035]ANC50760.1 hypothetical protein CP97_15069 [Aurantiacibacter atlanticus]MDP4540546.1 hypothetical protein [Qipengyuania sp. DY56-A-20]MXO49491.1 hypothetical protein [Qipengyuania vulgaris]|tara:strand:+ start:2458 stop:3024 length:567 start_codon:yes stop_codon:yes gene_type:complete